MTWLCSKYYLSPHKRFVLFGNIISSASIEMKPLKIVCSLCFLNLIIFINAKDDTRGKFIHSDDMEIDEVPRVKIKVFRGPNKEQDGKQFATWGFWIKQPATMKLIR